MSDIEKEVKSFNVIGSPDIDYNTGIVSEFSGANYLQLPETFNPGNNPWEMVTKISIDNNQAVMFPIGCRNGNNGFLIHYSNDGLVRFWLSSTGSSWDIAGPATSSTQYPVSSYFYTKISFNGSQYILSISNDKETWITVSIVSSTLAIFPCTIYLGSAWDKDAGYLRGSIDLSETYIDINGQRWWDFSMSTTYYGSTFKVHKTLPYLFGARGVGYYDSAVSKVPTANEDILLTMKTYDGLTETYTEGIGTAGKVDFTGTILPWKWDYNSGLDVSKYCLMPSGLTYENIDIGDKEPNLLYTDTATVSPDNVISNITRGLYTSQRFTFEKEKSFEIFCKVKTGLSVSNIREICTTVDPGPYLFMRVGGSKWNPVLVVNNSVVQGSVGSVSTNTVYYVRLKYFPTTQVIDSVTYSAHQAYFETSTDNVTWTRQHTFDLSTYFIGTTSSTTSYTFTLDFGSQGENSELWNGEIYSEDCYVKIDGVEVWNGLKPKYISLPGCTYNYIDDGAATTLNCFAVNGDESLVLTPDASYFGHPKIGTVNIEAHSVYQYNDGTWQASAYLTGGKQYYIKAIGGGGGSSTWDGGAGAYWEGLYTPATTVAVNIGTGGAGVGAGAYSRRHNGGKGGNTYMTGTDVSIICEGGQGAIGLRNGDETGNSSTYTYAPTINITNGTYNTIKASTHYRPRRVSWDDDTVTGYGAGGQAASGTKAPGNAGVEGFLEYYEAYSIVILTTPVDLNPTIEWFDEDPELNPSAIPVQIGGAYLLPEDGTTIYLKVSKEGYQSYYNNYTNVGQNTSEVVTLEEEEEPQS